MECLSCGWCCNTMLPITHGKCPNMIEPMDSVKRRLKQSGMTDTEAEEYVAALIANTAQKGVQTGGR